MTEEHQNCLYQNYANVQDPEKLQQIIRDIQCVASENCSSREETLEVQIADMQKQAQILDERLSCQSFCACTVEQPRWLLAEQDYPDGRAPVVFFDDREFEVRSAGDLRDCRAIASKLPSRWPGTVYVYTESVISAPPDSNHRVRISRKKGAPEGLRWSKTLHLNKLPLEIKVRILSGRIKWLFVIQADSRVSTESESWHAPEV